MTHHDDDIRAALHRLPPVEADPSFRARLRLDAQREFQRMRKDSRDGRRSREHRTRELRGGRREGDARRTPWLPWSMAVAASVLAVVFNVGGEFTSSVRVDEGLALVKTAEGWVRPASKIVEGDDAEGIYAGPESKVIFEKPQARIEATNDISVQINNDEIHCSPTGTIKVSPNRRMTIVVGEANERIILDKAQVKLKMEGGAPHLKVYSGVATYVAPDGKRKVVKKGQQSNLPIKIQIHRLDSNAVRQIEEVATEGKVIQQLLPKNIRPEDRERVRNLLILAQRLQSHNKADLKQAYKLMKQVDGETRELSTQLVQNRKLAEIIEIKKEIEREIELARQNRVVRVQDKLGRIYNFSFVNRNVFSVAKGDNDPIRMTREEIYELPPEIISGLPRDWGFRKAK